MIPMPATALPPGFTLQPAALSHAEAVADLTRAVCEEDGDRVAGVSICRIRANMGWVWSLGVRRPWRQKGLGMALLQHSFREFQRRGFPIAGLGVDASNPTGANRLYERAGMFVETEYVSFEKELRPGREPK